MKRHLFLWVSIFICLGARCGAAQVDDARANPEVKNVIIEEGVVTRVYLSPGYTTSVRLPEEVSSVVVGNPLTFKAEHAESEARLVFLKPGDQLALDKPRARRNSSAGRFSVGVWAAAKLADWPD